MFLSTLSRLHFDQMIVFCVRLFVHWSSSAGGPIRTSVSPTVQKTGDNKFLAVFFFITIIIHTFSLHRTLFVVFKTKPLLAMAEVLCFVPGCRSQEACLTSRRHKPGVCPWPLGGDKPLRNLLNWGNFFSPSKM